MTPDQRGQLFRVGERLYNGGFEIFRQERRQLAEPAKLAEVAALVRAAATELDALVMALRVTHDDVRQRRRR